MVEGGRQRRNCGIFSMIVTVSARGSSASCLIKVSLARRTEVADFRDRSMESECIMLFEIIIEKIPQFLLWRPPSTIKDLK